MAWFPLTLRICGDCARQAVEQEPDAAPVEAAPVESAPVEVAPEEAAAVEEQPEAEEPVAESKKVWEPSRTDWQDPAGASPAAGKAVSPEELKEATRYRPPLLHLQ